MNVRAKTGGIHHQATDREAFRELQGVYDLLSRFVIPAKAGIQHDGVDWASLFNKNLGDGGRFWIPGLATEDRLSRESSALFEVYKRWVVSAPGLRIWIPAFVRGNDD